MKKQENWIKCRKESEKEKMANINSFTIDEKEKLYLDSTELKSVTEYKLHHSAGGIAELTVTLEVNVNQVGFELGR